MQIDDNTGHLSAVHTNRDGIFRNITCLEKEKTNSFFEKSGI
jgi:hypothetical protein